MTPRRLLWIVEDDQFGFTWRRTLIDATTGEVLDVAWRDECSGSTRSWSTPRTRRLANARRSGAVDSLAAPCTQRSGQGDPSQEGPPPRRGDNYPAAA